MKIDVKSATGLIRGRRSGYLRPLVDAIYGLPVDGEWYQVASFDTPKQAHWSRQRVAEIVHAETTVRTIKGVPYLFARRLPVEEK